MLLTAVRTNFYFPLVNKDETGDMKNIEFNNLLLQSSNDIYAKYDS